jgi:hypothetical protein
VRLDFFLDEYVGKLRLIRWGGVTNVSTQLGPTQQEGDRRRSKRPEE